jgi:hypothetical protein
LRTKSIRQRIELRTGGLHLITDSAFGLFSFLLPGLKGFFYSPTSMAGHRFVHKSPVRSDHRYDAQTQLIGKL